jgi:hypothetical protein
MNPWDNMATKFDTINLTSNGTVNTSTITINSPTFGIGGDAGGGGSSALAGYDFSNTVKLTINANDTPLYNTVTFAPKYKYDEGKIIEDFRSYINKTYGQHYMTEEQGIECFDVWLALGDSMPTFRNTAIKYLWRYGKKKGSNKDDLMKVLHYTLMMLYVDHYKKGE